MGYVDIFACIHFRGFIKMGNFVWIKTHVLSITGSLGFFDFILSWIFKKCEVHEKCVQFTVPNKKLLHHYKLPLCFAGTSWTSTP